MFKYGYFVIVANGRVTAAGEDWGQTLNSYKPGDNLGVVNGVEGIVVDVIKGQEARLNGVDVMILLEERRLEKLSLLEYFRTHVLGRLIASRPRRLTSRPQIQTDFQGRKVRAVGKAIYFRPANESFHDFEVNLLLWELGEDWFNAEMAKPLEKRHAILKWRHERNEQLERHQEPGGDPSLPVRAPMTGSCMALQVLADDFYQIAHALDAPKKVIARLGDIHQFQGARYEVLVGSVLARCGCSIRFIDDTSKSNPDFIAGKSGVEIAVEAKSRHRSGVLNERGAFREDAPAEIKRLYEEALGQNPGDMPFIIFIDVNLPLTPGVPPEEKKWVKEAMETFEHRRQEGRKDSDTALILTNFGWHFSTDTQTPPGEFVIVKSENPQYPIGDETWTVLERALTEYGLIVDEEEYNKLLNK
jgi:hypothetical protein